MPKSKPAKPVAKTRKPAHAKVVKPAKAGARERLPAKAAKPLKSTKVNGKKNAEQAGRAEANHRGVAAQLSNDKRVPGKARKLTPFLQKQKDRLVQLRDSMLDSMMGVAKDTLRSRAEGSEASAFGMHQADAGSDAYDRDFALSLLSKEQDGLYEIEEALKRIDLGTYGVCEMSNKPIAHARLEAIPFARYTVECQSQLEKQNKHFNIRKPVTSLFGLTDEEPGEGEEEEPATEANKE
jgi:RNA polymerase-binding transcription factor DksA